jgi:peptidoglycan/xylan/chitin deacetylase (PgdA/CDA1 family)
LGFFVFDFMGNNVPIRLLKSIARTAFQHSGALHLVRWGNRPRLRILMYHQFSTGAEARRLIDRQCKYIRRYYTPVTLSDVSEWLSNGTPLPPNPIAITVDDGYRDFFTTAYPVLHAYGVPATLFVTTDFIDRKDWLWFDRVFYAFEHGRSTHVKFALGARVFEFQLDSAEQRRAAGLTTAVSAVDVADSDRQKLLARLERLLDVQFPSHLPENIAPLSWDELRAISRDGIEIGAHTRSHPILSRIECDTDLGDQVEYSKRRIEQELQKPVRHFCYPNGRAIDINKRVVEHVRAAGYKTAVTTISGLNDRSADPLLLKRIPAEPTTPIAYFRQCLAGFRVVAGSQENCS